MENALEPPQPAINLQEFLEKYKNQLTDLSECTNKVPFYFQSELPVTADVEASCALQLLASPDDNMINVFEPGAEIQRSTISQPKSKLPVPKTYTTITEHKARSRRNPFTRTQYSYRLVAEPVLSHEAKLLGEFELELTVRFYRPPRAAHRGYKLERPVFAQEFVCLGSNYLTALRDKISCICNGKRFVDISNDPDAPLPTLDTDPAYFFINDTFYNDRRNPLNCDYSQTVLDWARTAHGVQDEQLKCAAMEETRFIDLTVSMGAPLQYLHHGNCEHLFVISQMEVLRPNCKYLDRSLYPMLRAINNFNRRSCYMCGQRGYNFIVEKSNRQLHDPSYLCRNCFYSFNYVDGKKVGQFKAYRIYDKLDDSSDAEVQPEENPEDHSSEDDLDFDALVNS